MPSCFKDNGYATACIGKWHLGFHEPFLPRNQGFDHYFGLLHNLDPVEVVYFEDKGGVPLMRNDDVVKRPADPAELTKLYTDEAIGFIETEQGTSVLSLSAAHDAPQSARRERRIQGQLASGANTATRFRNSITTSAASSIR